MSSTPVKKKALPSRTNMLPPDPIFRLKSDMGHIHSLCFSDLNPSQLMASTEKGTVYFWDLETNRLQHKQEMGKEIQTIHSFGNKILSQEKSGVVKLWSLENASVTEEKKYDFLGGYCKSIVIDNLLVVPQVNSIDLVDYHNFTCVRKLEVDKENLGHIMAVQRVDIGAKTCLIAGYETGDVLLWDITASKRCSSYKFQEHLMTLTFDDASGRGVIGGIANNLDVFSVDSAYNMTLHCLLSITNEGCNVVKLRPDKKIFVSGGWDTRLRLFSWKSLRILVILTDHKSPITDVQYSANEIRSVNSKIMAVSDIDGVISLWNLYN